MTMANVESSNPPPAVPQESALLKCEHCGNAERVHLNRCKTCNDPNKNWYEDRIQQLEKQVAADDRTLRSQADQLNNYAGIVRSLHKTDDVTARELRASEFRISDLERINGYAEETRKKHDEDVARLRAVLDIARSDNTKSELSMQDTITRLECELRDKDVCLNVVKALNVSREEEVAGCGRVIKQLHKSIDKLDALGREARVGEMTALLSRVKKAVGMGHDADDGVAIRAMEHRLRRGVQDGGSYTTLVSRLQEKLATQENQMKTQGDVVGKLRDEVTTLKNQLHEKNNECKTARGHTQTALGTITDKKLHINQLNHRFSQCDAELGEQRELIKTLLGEKAEYVEAAIAREKYIDAKRGRIEEQKVTIKDLEVRVADQRKLAICLEEEGREKYDKLQGKLKEAAITNDEQDNKIRNLECKIVDMRAEMHQEEEHEGAIAMTPRETNLSGLLDKIAALIGMPNEFYFDCVAKIEENWEDVVALQKKLHALDTVNSELDAIAIEHKETMTEMAARNADLLSQATDASKRIEQLESCAKNHPRTHDDKAARGRLSDVTRAIEKIHEVQNALGTAFSTNIVEKFVYVERVLFSTKNLLEKEIK